MRSPYEHFAVECVSPMARRTEPEQRAVLLEMAQMWVHLSEQVASIRSRHHGHLRLVADEEKLGALPLSSPTVRAN
jgi:hypothetical protein